MNKFSHHELPACWKSDVLNVYNIDSRCDRNSILRPWFLTHTLARTQQERGGLLTERSVILSRRERPGL